MSDSSDSHNDVHEGPIKTPRQLVLTVLASFIIPIVVIILMANFVSSGTKPSAGSDGLGAQAVAQRLKPVGAVEVRDASAPQVLKTGTEVFQGACNACHGAGVAGAPKVGDAAAWAPRIQHGYEALLTSALKGKGAMPPQGGGDFSDVEVGRAVVYMTNQAGAKFAEPQAPAVAASGADAAASAAPGAASGAASGAN